MKSWVEPKFIEPHPSLVRVAGHPLLAQILARRGFAAPATARAYLDPDTYTPAPPSELPDLPIAAARLRDAIVRGEPILVWGDFDVDGQTATSLLVAALRELGGNVRAYIPDRLREGHGIDPKSLQQRLTGIDVLLTCDTGVAEHQAIAYAQSLGVTVLVTDHHDLPPQLPAAEAVVDPKRLPPDHALRELPGVAVAFKVIQELHRLVGQDPDRLEDFLDLVALGIVVDVASQTGDTRYLLQRGMSVLRRTRRVGLQALIKMAKLNPAHLTTDHVGFAIGPRLNALGRLGDANLAVELLTTDDLGRARILAAQLESLNDRRRLLTEQIYAAAQEQIAKDSTLLDTHALVVSGPRWHVGVIGIVASRLTETYGRPVVVISAGDDDGDPARGSARSVPGVDIHAAISAVESLLISHGGHAGAAGLSLPVERINEFRHTLSRAVEARWDRSITPGLMIDAFLSWNAPSLELVERLNTLAPFGEGNPPVVLASQRLSLDSSQVFGRDQAHRRLTVRDTEGTTRIVIWWRGAEYALPTGEFDLAYVLKASDYRGERQLQIEYIDARIVSAPPIPVELPTIQVVDHRLVANPAGVLEGLRRDRNVMVWAEGYTRDQSPGLRRDQLEQASTLIVWTPPPGPREWRATLEHVSPKTVHVFAVPNDGTDPSQFLPRLAGMLKYTLRRKQGVADLVQLAAASGQRMATAREGIRLLDARGDVRIVNDGSTTVQLAPGDGRTRSDFDIVFARLQALLQETAAYRRFFARIPTDQLM